MHLMEFMITPGPGITERGASQIGDKPYRWQVNSVTVNSVTGVSQFGDSHTLSTNDIFRPYTSRVCLHLAKFIVENNF